METKWIFSIIILMVASIRFGQCIINSPRRGNHQQQPYIRFPDDETSRRSNDEIGKIKTVAHDINVIKLNDDSKPSRESKGLSAVFTYQKYWGSGDHQHSAGYGTSLNNLNNWNANLNQNYNVNYNTFNDEAQSTPAPADGVTKPSHGALADHHVDPHYPQVYHGYGYAPLHGGSHFSGQLVIGRPFRHVHRLRNFGINVLGLGHIYGTKEVIKSR